MACTNFWPLEFLDIALHYASALSALGAGWGLGAKDLSLARARCLSHLQSQQRLPGIIRAGKPILITSFILKTCACTFLLGKQSYVSCPFLHVGHQKDMHSGLEVIKSTLSPIRNQDEEIILTPVF